MKINKLAFFIYLFTIISNFVFADSTSLVDQYNRPEIRIGYSVGASGMYVAEKLFSKAKLLPYDDYTVALLAVSTGKIDALVYDRLLLNYSITNGLKNVQISKENIGDKILISVGISRQTKYKDLREKLNEFISEIKSNGIMQEMYDRWVFQTNAKMPDLPVPGNPDKKLVVGTTGTVPPCTFYQNLELTGYDIEFIKRFAYYYNADVTFKIFDFNGIVAAAQSGIIDCIASNLNQTEEEKEFIDYSAPYMEEYNALLLNAAVPNASSDYVHRQNINKYIISLIFITIIIYIVLSVKNNKITTRETDMQKTDMQKNDIQKTDMPLIKINNLKKTFDNITPIKNISTEIKQGEIISIIGPSGTGKSTFLRCLNMLETPTEGEIYVDGENITDPNADLPKIRRKMGMVFQSFNLFPHKMVIENIMMGQVDLLGITPQEAYDEGIRLLELVGLKDKAKNYPDELSGGQKQRVAIARALAMKPQIILFDEPTSALDPTMVSEVLSVIKQLAKQGLTMMIVTHEMKFAKEIATRVFYMDQGIIYEEGTPKEIFENPQKELTRNFIFKIRSWTYEINDNTYDLYGMMGSLENFASKQFLSLKQLNRLKLVIEEIVTTNCLIHVYSDGKKANYQIIIYAAEEGKEIIIKVYSDLLNKDFIDKLTNKKEDNFDLSAKMFSKILTVVSESNYKRVEFTLKS